MAIKIGSLFGDVTLRSAQLDKDVRGIQRKLRGVGKGMKSFGRSMSTYVTAPIVAMGVASLKTFSDFEKGMNEVRSLMPDLNQDEFKDLSEDVRALSVDIGVDLVDSVGALYQAISAGVPRDNVIDFLRTATKTGIAGLSTTETAVDALTSILNAYKRPAEDAEAVSDVLFTTVRLGKTTFDEIAVSIAKVAPIAAAMNVPIEEVLAAVASLTKQGAPTSEAMTQVRGALVALAKPTATLKDAIVNLGYESGQALLDDKGLQGALQAIRTESGLLDAEMAEAFGRVEALSGVLGTTGENFRGAVADLHSVTEAYGAMQAAFEENNQGIARSFEKTLSILRELGVLIGQDLAPHMQRLATKFKQWYDLNRENLPNLVELAAKIAAITAVVGPLAITLGSIALILGGPAGLVALFTALVAGSVLLMTQLGILDKFWQALGVVWVKILEGDIKGAIWAVIGALGEWVLATNPLNIAFEILWKRILKPMFNWLIDKLDWVLNLFGRLFSNIKRLGSKAIGGAMEFAGFRAEGGPVSAGSPYIVGEQGPELFVPRYSGNIVANHQLQGGQSGPNVTMNFAPGTDMQTVAALKNMRHTIADWAVQAVREDNLRHVAAI